MPATIDTITVADDADPWRALGFEVGDDGVCAIASAFGAQTNLHCSGTSVDIAAALHLSSTFPLSNFVGVPRPFYQETVLEFHRLAHPIRDKVGTPFVVKDGYVDVPTGPGLGIEIDLDFVKRMSAS